MDQDAIRAEIAARYGIEPANVAPVQVIPRGVSGLPDPAVGRHWGSYKEEVRRIYQRQKKFERVARKEFAPPPPPKAPPPEKMPKERKRIERRPELVRRDGDMRLMVAEGMTLKQIAARLNIPVKTADTAIRKLGLAPARPPAKPKAPPKEKDRSAYLAVLAAREERIEKLRQLAAEGRGSFAVSQIMNLNQETVRKLAHRHGIKFGRERRKAPTNALDPQEVAALFNGGMSVTALTKHFRRKTETIRKALTEAGVVRRPYTTATRMSREAVAKLHAEGLAEAAIVAETGMSRAAVQRALNALGLKPNKAKQKSRDENTANVVWIMYHDKGLSMARIGAELDIPKSRVMRLLDSKRKAA